MKLFAFLLLLFTLPSLTLALDLGAKIGVIQTAPGVIVSNAANNTSGHLQAQADQGGTVGLFLAPEKEPVFSFFAHLDYFTFTTDSQLLNEKFRVNLGTSMTGSVIELIPGGSFYLHFGKGSYTSLGAGYGIRAIDIAGNIYLTDGDVRGECETPVADQNVQGIQRGCERYKFEESVQTTATLLLYELKLWDFLFVYTVSSSSTGLGGGGSGGAGGKDVGGAKDAPKQTKGDYSFRVAMTSMKLVYTFLF